MADTDRPDPASPAAEREVLLHAPGSLRLASDGLPWQRSLRWEKPTRNRRVFWLGFALAFFVTVIGGFIAKRAGLELPETVAPVAWALIAGGLVIFAVEAYAARQPVRDTLTWSVAFWVGAAQIVAATQHTQPEPNHDRQMAYYCRHNRLRFAGAFEPAQKA